MSTPGNLKPTVNTSTEKQPLYRAERVIASLTVAWVVILTTYMIFQNHALSHTSIYFLKIILSLSGAVMLATLPGFFDINYTLGGFTVRAAGGAAAFVFIYTQSPNLPSLDANATPAPQQERQPSPKQDKLSAVRPGYPAVLAMSPSPPAYIVAPGAQRGSGTYHQSGFTGAISSPGGGLDASGGWGASLQRISFGEAVQSDLRAFVSLAADYLTYILQTAKSWLDMAAAALRSGLERLFDTAKALLGLKTGNEPAAETIGVVTQDLPAALGEVTDSLLDPESPLGGLLIGIDSLTHSLIGGLSQSISGLVSVTDRTVQTLMNGLQDTIGKLFSTTEGLVNSTTDLLNDTTAGLTAPIGDLTSNVTGKAGKLVDDTLGGTAATASEMLNDLNSEIGKVTESLNAITPALIARLDPDFAARQTPLGKLDGDAFAFTQDLTRTLGDVAAPLTSTLNVPLDGSSDGDFLLSEDALSLNRLDGAALLSDQPGQLLNTIGQSDAVCVAGCEPEASTGLIAQSLGAVPTALTGGLGGGIASDAGPGGESGPIGGGGNDPVSSTVSATGSIVGGALSKLKRR